MTDAHAKQRGTVAQRGAEFFGENNTVKMRAVKVGRKQVAFVGKDRVWIYNEDPRLSYMVVKLSDQARTDLIDALGGRCRDD